MHSSPCRSVVALVAVVAVLGAGGRVSARQAEGIALRAGSELVFADVAEGAALLGAEDDYTRHASPFDRQAKVRRAGPVSDEEFRAFAARAVLPWTDAERQALADAATRLAPRLETLRVPVPPRVVVVKTSGDEEGNAAYTRGTAIMLPRRMLSGGPAALERLLCHELFHVVSRSAPALRRRLYASIGFEPCGDVVLPPHLRALRLTNPDAPAFDHAISVNCDGERRWMVPVLFASGPYDAKAGMPFFASMVFRLMAVERRGQPDGTFVADPWLDAGGRPLLRSPDEVAGFFEQTGRNTAYLIHPEEIMADNFVHLVVGPPKAGVPLPTPAIVEGMERILAEHADETARDVTPSGD